MEVDKQAPSTNFQIPNKSQYRNNKSEKKSPRHGAWGSDLPYFGVRLIEGGDGGYAVAFIHLHDDDALGIAAEMGIPLPSSSFTGVEMTMPSLEISIKLLGLVDQSGGCHFTGLIRNFKGLNALLHPGSGSYIPRFESVCHSR